MAFVPVASISASGAGSSAVAVGVTVVATLVVVALLAALVSVIRAARALRQAAEDLSAESAARLELLDGTLAHADAELARVDDLVGSAEQLTETVSTASKAAYVTLANPLIKVMAFRRGSSRAAQRWRARRDLRPTVIDADRQPAGRQLPGRRSGSAGHGREATAGRRLAGTGGAAERQGPR